MGKQASNTARGSSWRLACTRRAYETEGFRMPIFQLSNGAFMHGRKPRYWIAGAFLWGLTSVGFAEVPVAPPGNPAAHTSSAHPNNVRSADRPQTHSHSPRTKTALATKPASTQTTKQPEQNYSAALSQYQFAYGNANVPFSPQPEAGASTYAGTTIESQIVKRNSTQYGAPATSASSARSTAPDDTWRFMANPLINATHSHEIGAAVSVRHDF
jgi:hypothetical protein